MINVGADWPQDIDVLTRADQQPQGPILRRVHRQTPPILHGCVLLGILAPEVNPSRQPLGRILFSLGTVARLANGYQREAVVQVIGESLACLACPLPAPEPQDLADTRRLHAQEAAPSAPDASVSPASAEALECQHLRTRRVPGWNLTGTGKAMAPEMQRLPPALGVRAADVPRTVAHTG